MNPLIPILALLLLASASLQAVPRNFLQNAVDGSTMESISAVQESSWPESGTSVQTVQAPVEWNGYRFTHWSVSGSASTVLRDPWGRSLNPVGFQITAQTTATAHYLPASRDEDADGLPDWFEIEYFGTLDRTAEDDSDGDGRTALQEYLSGSNPLFAETHQSGGVSRGESGLVTVNLAGYASYTLRSEPEGQVDFTQVAPPGTIITTPEMSGSSFGYWTVDGVPQRDAWGVALRSVVFEMGETDREAVAWFFEGDSDSDGLADAWEQYYLGTLDFSGGDDPNGDGYTLLQEFLAGRSPTLRYAHQPGGVSRGESGLVTVNLAGYASYTLRSEPEGQVDFTQVAPPGTIITTPEMSGSSFGYWTVDGVPQRDAWGVALRSVVFEMGETDREAVAWFFEGDSDSDGLADAWEQYYLGTLDFSGGDDPNGDGYTLLQEFLADRAPTLRYAHQPGGVSWADSELLTVDFTEFPLYTFRSEPAGYLEESGRAPEGTLITSPFLHEPSFGYWTLDGVPQRDAQGRAWRQITFAMGADDREAVAWFYEGDTDGNGVPDAWEYFHFGRLLGSTFSDADGDGQSDRAEWFAGTNPFDRTDVFKITGIGMSGGQVEIRWRGKPGKTYRVLHSANLASWQTLVDYSQRLEGDETVVTDRSPSGTRRFYRVEVVD